VSWPGAPGGGAGPYPGAFGSSTARTRGGMRPWARTWGSPWPGPVPGKALCRRAAGPEGRAGCRGREAEKRAFGPAGGRRRGGAGAITRNPTRTSGQPSPPRTYGPPSNQPSGARCPAESRHVPPSRRPEDGPGSRYPPGQSWHAKTIRLQALKGPAARTSAAGRPARFLGDAGRPGPGCATPESGRGPALNRGPVLAAARWQEGRPRRFPDRPDGRGRKPWGQ